MHLPVRTKITPVIPGWKPICEDIQTRADVAPALILEWNNPINRVLVSNTSQLPLLGSNYHSPRLYIRYSRRYQLIMHGWLSTGYEESFGKLLYSNIFGILGLGLRKNACCTPRWISGSHSWSVCCISPSCCHPNLNWSVEWIFSRLRP